MISDLDLARACQAAYHEPPTLPVPPTETDVRITSTDDGAIVAFRGSASAEDWLRDFMAEPIVDRAHPQLGPCHAGFLDGAESVATAIGQAVGNRPFWLTGHSLGGALALGVGALLLLAGQKAQAIVTFGAPRFGGDRFVAAIAPLPVRQWHRGNCPVVLVPFDLPPLLRFLDARLPLIPVGVAQRDPIACHSIDGYVVDVGAFLSTQAAGAAA